MNLAHEWCGNICKVCNHSRTYAELMGYVNCPEKLRDTPEHLRIVLGMKDHEIQEFINDLRNVAKEYGQTQQLRERIHSVVMAHLNSWCTDCNKIKTLAEGMKEILLHEGKEDLW